MNYLYMRLAPYYMSEIWLYTLISVFLVSAVSLAGALIIVIRQSDIKRFLLFAVSFAAGALLGDVFLHILPELAEKGHFDKMTSVYIMAGILMFFILEKVMHWRHCHLSAVKDHMHPLAFMNLVGDAVHNFIDGILIAASYLLSIPVGIATTVAVILHEIPQEMGDFGVMLHAGMKARKALAFNFLSALTSALGAVIVLGLRISESAIIETAVPVVAGGFLYIANADLIPELHKDVKIGNSVIQLISFLAGIGVMFVLTFAG